MSMGLVTTAAKNTVFGDLVAGIRWTATPLLMAGQKSAYEAQALAAPHAGAVPDPPLYRSGGAGREDLTANLFYWTLTSCASGTKTLRRSLRSPRWFVAMVALLFVRYEALALLGAISFLVECWVASLIMVSAAKNAFVESLDVAHDWALYFEEWCDWAVRLMPLQR